MPTGVRPAQPGQLVQIGSMWGVVVEFVAPMKGQSPEKP